MERNQSQKKEKENDRDAKWYAKMNAIEALWKSRIEESRIEYLATYLEVIKKRSESKLL